MSELADLSEESRDHLRELFINTTYPDHLKQTAIDWIHELEVQVKGCTDENFILQSKVADREEEIWRLKEIARRAYHGAFHLSTINEFNDMLNNE